MDLAKVLTQIDDVLYTWLLIYLLPGILAIIMADAFNFKSIFGGFTGSCMVLGIKRGLFSNEAGMGSAPNASASATVSHPAKQGLAQIISVYIDTLLICSTTVFLILLTGDWADSGYSGIPLLQQCVARVIGPVGIHFVTVIVCLFAFTSIIGNYFYAEANILFITKILLGNIAFKTLDDYEAQMARGLDPVFHESNIGLTNTDVWKDSPVEK